MSVSGFRKGFVKEDTTYMTFRKTLAALLCAGAMFSQTVRAAAATNIPVQKQYLPPQQYYAAPQGPYQYDAALGQKEAAMAAKAADLITAYYDYLSVGNGCVNYAVNTTAASRMTWIGVKNITLQYSPNNVSWSNVQNIGDRGNWNAYVYNGSFSFSTSRGVGYYRIKVTHYAYNLFKDQSIHTFSNTVKIYY